MNCDFHKARLGVEVEATKFVAGSAMCEDCFGGAMPGDKSHTVKRGPGLAGSRSVRYGAAYDLIRAVCDGARETAELHITTVEIRTQRQNFLRVGWKKKIRLTSAYDQATETLVVKRA